MELNARQCVAFFRGLRIHQEQLFFAINRRETKMMKPLRRFMVKTAMLFVALSAAIGAHSARAGPAGLWSFHGKKATGEPIAIGAVVGEHHGPTTSVHRPWRRRPTSRRVNDNGGINGRPINYIMADDQWNPEAATPAAAKLVRDRKVLAMAGSASFVECGANAKLYAAEDVMVIAGVGVPRGCFFSQELRTGQHRPARVGHAGGCLRGAGLQGQAQWSLHRSTDIPSPGQLGLRAASRAGARSNGVAGWKPSPSTPARPTRRR